MVFIDGTNLFYRLEKAKLRLRGGRLARLCKGYVGGDDLIRVCLYTSSHQLEKANAVHGPDYLAGIRVLEGLSVIGGDGRPREKAVDAMLVADLVYHAATRNIDRAVLVSVDQDFVHAIRRVEDFGCRTAVVGICTLVPQHLRSAVDEVHEVPITQMMDGEGRTADPIA